VTTRIDVLAAEPLPEVRPGDDLARLVAAAAVLRDGDVVVVTSKVVSKAEGQVVQGARDAVIEAETVRVVARRGPTTIARTRQGLTLAAAGVDASNTDPGTVVVLPEDPDASARMLRARLLEQSGRNVAVVVSDTAGRPWREGQTDIAIGCAGILPLEDHAGRSDTHGNLLEVTEPAVADEVAAAADLVKGKASGRPVAVVRGLAGRVLPPGDDGPGAAAVLRDEAGDMFVLGAREAVYAAVCRDDAQATAALGGNSARHSAHADLALLAELARRSGSARPPGGDRPRDAGRLRVRALGDEEAEVEGHDDLATAASLERMCALAVVHGWWTTADERNLGRCRIVLRRGNGGP
jgi:coenzyme F420-0:L-glutamate ligase/coenzyme F420-1:gamma-L-glutamate ligase